MTIFRSTLIGLLLAFAALVFPLSAMAATSISGHTIDENQVAVTGEDLDLVLRAKFALITATGKPVTKTYYRPGCECGVNDPSATVVWNEGSFSITDPSIGGAHIKSVLLTGRVERGATRTGTYNYKFSPYALIEDGATIPVAVNTVAPTVTGDLNPGEVLSVNTGSWTNSPFSYSYIWMVDGNDFGGAYSNATFTLDNSHIGKMISVRVWAINAGGVSMPVDSAEVGPVTAPAVAPTNMTLPLILGSAQVGEELTLTDGSWDGTIPLSFSYQWLRCDNAGDNCVNIAGATSQTYNLVETDEGSTIRVDVTATNSVGSETARSVATDVVAEASEAPEGGIVHRSTLPAEDPNFFDQWDNPTVPVYTSIGGYPVDSSYGEIYCEGAAGMYYYSPSATVEDHHILIRYYDLTTGDDLTGWLPLYTPLLLDETQNLAGKVVGCRTQATIGAETSPVYSSPGGLTIYATDPLGDKALISSVSGPNPVTSWPGIAGDDFTCYANVDYWGVDSVTVEYRLLSYPGNTVIGDWTTNDTFTIANAGFYYCDARATVNSLVSDPVQIHGVARVLSGEPVLDLVNFYPNSEARVDMDVSCSPQWTVAGSSNLFEIIDQDNNVIYTENKAFDDEDWNTAVISYTMQAGDVGKTLRCRVTATNSLGSDTLVSDNDITVLPPYTYDQEWTQLSNHNGMTMVMNAEEDLYAVTGSDMALLNGVGSPLSGKDIDDFDSDLVVAEGELYRVSDVWSPPIEVSLVTDAAVPANLVGISGRCFYSATEVTCEDNWGGGFTSYSIPLDSGEEIAGLNSAGSEGTCLYTTLNKVYCWGDKYYYNGDTSDASAESTPQLQLVGSLAGKTIRGIAVQAKDLITWCAIDTNDDAHCAGNNYSGMRTGIAPTGYSPEWIADYDPVPSINTIGKVASMSGTMYSYGGMCAIDLSGKLQCRGGSQYGETGGLYDCDYSGTETWEDMTHRLDSASCYQTQNETIVAYAEGAFITSDGRLWGIGYSAPGGVWNGDFQDRAVPDPT